jgi:arginyl-tRNA---protein transferase
VSEYTLIRRPTDPLTKKPIEPAHKFEVSLESDAFSVEKSVVLSNPTRACR